MVLDSLTPEGWKAELTKRVVKKYLPSSSKDMVGTLENEYFKYFAGEIWI